MTEYRVDSLPLALRPLVWLYGYGLGLAWYAYYLVQRLTTRVRIEGAERIDPTASLIFCHWHGMIPLNFQCSVPRIPRVLAGRPHVSMQHPLWFMKAVHVMLRLMGVKQLALGSTGHEGRHAADELVGYLRSGYSTMLFPDGPAGPPRVLKRGVLHIAAQSGVPIVPLRLEATRCVTLNTWDSKQFPLPFSTIRIRIGAPIAVPAGELERAERELTAALGG